MRRRCASTCVAHPHSTRAAQSVGKSECSTPCPNADARKRAQETKKRRATNSSTARLARHKRSRAVFGASPNGTLFAVGLRPRQQRPRVDVSTPPVRPRLDGREDERTGAVALTKPSGACGRNAVGCACCGMSVMAQSRPKHVEMPAGSHALGKLGLRMSGRHMLPRGLEPRTLRLLAVRSNQLSYESW